MSRVTDAIAAVGFHAGGGVWRVVEVEGAGEKYKKSFLWSLTPFVLAGRRLKSAKLEPNMHGTRETKRKKSYSRKRK